MKSGGMTQQPQDVENTCKSCERYIGPTVVCPFCGHKNRRTTRITVTKNVALAVAIVGLLALHAWSMSYGTPAMNIDDLGETSNYAMVEISGVVARTPVYYPGEDGAPGTIYFTIDDGTQQVSVRAYPIPVVQDMLATGKIPAFGDRVNVTGNVYWYNAERGFILNDLENLEIDRPGAVNMSIAEIGDLDYGATDGYYRVATSGTVSSWRKFDFALDVTLIDENDNEVSIYIPNAVFDLTGMGPLGTLEVGMGLEAVGCLEYYDAGSYSKWEIIPASADDIRVVSPDLAVTGIEVSDLSFPLNQQFTVNVTVANLGQLPVSTAGLTITFDGGTVYTVSVGGLAPGESDVISYSTSVTDMRTGLAVGAAVSVPEPLQDSVTANDSMQVTEGSP